MEVCSKLLCADYARLGFYYARHYAQHYARASFIMREIMRGACNNVIHYAQIMSACVLLCAALCATLCADSSHYARNVDSALCPPWLSTPSALRLSNNPSIVHTHHGMAEPANAISISCHSQVEARIIPLIISAHNNYSHNLPLGSVLKQYQNRFRKALYLAWWSCLLFLT